MNFELSTMPGPFPGMDPYLESPFYWRDFHARFIATAANALQRLVPPRYRARIDERLILEGQRQMRYPDVSVVQRPAVRETAAAGGEPPAWMDDWLRQRGARPPVTL